MNRITEQNAARRRNSALVLAIVLHIALVAALYFGHTDQAVNKQLTSPENTLQNSPKPQAKAVNLP